jgi:hypothetical protein
MAKASTGSVTAKEAKPGAAELPARKKAIVVSAAKSATSTRAGSKKSAGRQTAAKSAVAKRLSASGKTTAGKAAPKRRVSGQAGRPTGAAKRASALKAAPAKSGSAKKTGAAKRATGKTAAARMATGKGAASKTAAPRRAPAKAAAPAPAARRTRQAGSPKRVQPPPSPAPAKPPQSFTVSHLNDADFKADGLRSYAQYRDLGIAAATAGLCQAHVIRFVPPCTDEVRKRHRHAADLQLVYVLQGWVKNEFEGVGEQMMSTGTCWLQPSGIEHTVLDYSADCEVLEIVVPADFRTEEID